MKMPNVQYVLLQEHQKQLGIVLNVPFPTHWMFKPVKCARNLARQMYPKRIHHDHRHPAKNVLEVN